MNSYERMICGTIHNINTRILERSWPTPGGYNYPSDRISSQCRRRKSACTCSACVREWAGLASHSGNRVNTIKRLPWYYFLGRRAYKTYLCLDACRRPENASRSSQLCTAYPFCSITPCGWPAMRAHITDAIRERKPARKVPIFPLVGGIKGKKPCDTSQAKRHMLLFWHLFGQFEIMVSAPSACLVRPSMSNLPLR